LTKSKREAENAPVAKFKKAQSVIAIVVLYIVADMILTHRELYFLNLLPFVLIVIYLALARIDWCIS